MPGEYISEVWTSRRTRRRLFLLLCGAALALASVTWAASTTSRSPSTAHLSSLTAQQASCTTARAAAAERAAVDPTGKGSDSAEVEQTLAVVVEPPECPPAQPSEAKQEVLASHQENTGSRVTAAARVALTLRISPNQQTTCEIVLRDYSHLEHPIHTRTRYCRSNVRRGRWEQRGPAQHLPRWAILTASARRVRVEISLSALLGAAQPIGHATVYLSSSAPHQSTPVKLLTNAQGRASAFIPYGPTRVLTATYPGEGGYEATGTQVEAQFQAATSDFASTRYISSGAPVTFSGALLAGPLPKGQASAARIRVQYRLRNRWVTWGATNTRGAKWRMTLALALSPRALTTRAIVLPTAKYPYIEGTSRIVHLYITHPVAPR
jgi:hypothetical protein